MSAAQARAYVSKAEEYRSAATTELDADRPIAATSLAIHAAINAADAVTGVRLGVRAAGQDHDEAIVLLRTAGPDGLAVAKELGRLLPMKTRAEYEPDEIPKSDASRAVERARRIVELARRKAAGQRSNETQAVAVWKESATS
ncbi:MAG: HEPN domain-containing protein [Acidimicrobiia bacterium]|nr:HEPN domain-containing protein [Acidimicrobiia bacterium]